jgi:serine/threonine protein kinase
MADGQLLEGTLLNERYRILRSLGKGGMGTVYLAEHIRLNAILAVKQVHARQPTEPEQKAVLEQYEQEARFLVRLNHPNLPKVTDAFIEGDYFYLVMEFIEGVTLETRLKEAGGNPLDVGQVVEWGLQIADVLSYLHSQSPPIIFRDLKPANVMVQPDGNIRLIDFGIARLFQPGAVKDTALLGSVGYSPPEQFGRHQTDTRSDIYAFGATLHHLLTGQDPVNHPFKFMPAHVLNPAVPETLSRLLDHCLAMDADARPAGIHQVALDLLSMRDELAARPPQPAPAPLADGETSPGQGSPSGGPRIISAKLAEVEAQKRRSGSQEPRVPSGRVTGPPLSTPLTASNRLWRGVILALCILLILGGTGLALRLAKSRPSVPMSSARPIVTPLLPVHPAPGAVSSPPRAPAPTYNANNTIPTPPTATERPATFGHVEARGIFFDQERRPYLRLYTDGLIRGQRSRSGTVAVFFYKESGDSLPARDPQSVFANRDGQLSLGQSLQVLTDPQPFQVMLDVPLEQLLATPAVTVIKYRWVVFLEGQSVGETDLTLLPDNLLRPFLSAPNRGAPSNGGASLRVPSGARTDQPKGAEGSIHIDSNDSTSH